MDYFLFLLLAFLVGCMASHKGLTDEEKAKLDSGLLQLLSAEASGQSVSPDEVVHVIIHTSDLEALKQMGLDLQSTYDRFATARVSVQQLRQLLAMPSVQYIEMGSTNRPQK